MFKSNILVLKDIRISFPYSFYDNKINLIIKMKTLFLIMIKF